MYNSTIFKTFDSDTDKFISKIGILGRSFEQIGDNVRQRNLEIHELMGAMSETDAKKEVGSFWDYVFGNKSNKEKPLDLSTFIDFDETNAGNTLKKLQEIEGSVKSGETTWQEYFSGLNDGQKWQVQFVQNNDLQKASVDDVIVANKAARQTAIDYNSSLKSMTLGAKAAAIGMKALAIAGNILVFTAISKGIQLAVEAIDNYVHRVEKAKEALSTSVANLDTTTNDVKELENQLSEVDQKINDINSLGGAQVSKDGELEKLQEQHDQLEANLALMREQSYFDAKDVADKASDSYNTTVTSQYKSELVDRGNNSRERFLEVAPTEELELSISAYKEYSGQLSKINNEIVAKELEINQARTNNQSTKALEKELATLTGTKTELEGNVENARKRSMDMAKIVNDVIEANKQIENLQYDLTPKQLEEFEDAKKNYSEYDKFYKQFVSGILTSDDKLQSKSNNAKKGFDFADEDTAKELDSYQNKFVLLASAIDKVRNSNLTGSELFDLQQEFPELLKNTGDLDTALTKLVDDTLDKGIRYLEAAGAPAGVIKVFKQMAKEAKELSSIDWTGNFDLSSFSDTIDRLSKITSLYDEFKGKIKDKAAITFDISDVDDLRSSLLKTDKQLGISEEQFNTFESVLSSSESTVDDIQKAFDTLSSQFIYQSGCLDGLNTSNRDLIVSQLELQGITNASSIVTEELAQASEILAASGYSLTDATNTAYWALLDESGASEATKASLYQLNAAEIAYNNTDLSVQGKIDKLGQLASAYGDTASAAIAAAAADRVANGHGTYESVMEDLIAQMNRATSNITIQAPKISGSPSKKSGSGSKGSKGQEPTEFDTAAESIKNLRAQLDSLNEILENTDPYSQKLDTIKLIIAKQQEYNDALKSQAELYQAEYQKSLTALPQQWQDNITGDRNFSIAEIPASLKDAVSRAQDFKDKLNSVNQSILKANRELNDTKQKIYDLAQTKLDNQIGIIENKISDIQNKMDEADAMGLQATKKQYRNMISLSKQEASVYQDKLQGLMAVMAVMEAAGETDTDNYYKTAEAIQSCEDAISKCAQNQSKWNKAMLELPIQYLERANDELNDQLDGLKEEQNRLDGAISGVTAHLQNQIDVQQRLRDEAEKAAQEKIDAINKEKEALQETNEKRKQQLELEKAQYNLERAKNQKTVRIFREGSGEFEYENDKIAELDAQNAKDELEFNNHISDLDDKIKDIEKSRDELLNSYDKEIDRLQIIMDAWNDITDAIQRAKDMAMANSVLGTGWQDRVTSGDTSDIGNITGKYEQNDKQQTWVEQQIEANERLIKEVERYVEAWQMGEMSIREARESINDIVGDIAPEIEANDERVDSISTYQNQWTNANQSVQGNIAAINAAAANNVEELTATEQRRYAAQMYADQWATNVLTVGESLNSITTANSDATVAEGEFLNTRITNLTSFQSRYTTMAANIVARCREIVNACREAERAMDRLEKKESGGGYASGTQNAKPGLHDVAEGNKPEIIVNNDGSALLAEKETVYPFKGGEKVLNASETENVLSKKNFTPIDVSQLIYNDTDFSALMKNMIPNNVMRKNEVTPVFRTEKQESVDIKINNLNLPRVKDPDSFAQGMYDGSFRSAIQHKKYRRR